MTDTQENESGCPQTSNGCPSSPFPGEYPKPKSPNNYYDKLSVEIKEKLLSEYEKAKNTAEEKKIEAENKAKDEWKAASSEYEAAKEKYGRDVSLLGDKSKNKKLEIRQNYRNKLRESLPKNNMPNSCPGIPVVDIEEDPKVKDEDRAVCIADFKKALADEELDYLTKMKALNDLFQEAENKYKKAKNNFEFNKCNAIAINEQAKAVGELEWRKKLSVEVKKIS